MFYTLIGTNTKGFDYEWCTKSMDEIKSKIKILWHKGVREFTINGQPVTQEMIDYVL